MEILPERAVVRPRVLLRNGEHSTLLEDEILPLVESGACGAIAVCGPPGSGRTTALRHLAAVLPTTAGIRLADDPAAGALVSPPRDRLIVYAAYQPRLASASHLAELTLAPWTHDDCIEYLLATNRDRCASVMARVRTAAHTGLLLGRPELWRAALDEMAADEAVADPLAALCRRVESLLGAGRFAQVRRGCLVVCRERLLGVPASRAAAENADATLDPDQGWCRVLPGEGPGFEAAERLLRHVGVSLALAADEIVDDLRNGLIEYYLAGRWPRPLFRLIAAGAAREAAVLDTLRRAADSESPEVHALAASLVHAAGAAWRPTPGRHCDLAGALLGGVAWTQADLRGTCLSDSDLSRAALAGANLASVHLERAILRDAWMPRVVLEQTKALRAVLAGADLLGARARGARLQEADLSGARLDVADLSDARLVGADLRGAHLTGACLAGADLTCARLAGADLTDADLTRAILTGLDLSWTVCARTRFTEAALSQANLEGIQIDRPDFQGAVLALALLTGSRLWGANFHKASLVGARLAAIDWPHADLRDADLRHATFHLGTSRSGLVGSPLACEGSRTGFYRDDLAERWFRSPEEIRKANLYGADLRGAAIDGTDFYLVDLRQARLDPDQRRYVRHGGAILEDPERP